MWVSVRVKQKSQKSTRQNYSQSKAKSSKINRFQRIFGAAGQIRTADLILTKSVSRFGRNTLDGLDTVRKLKRKGIGVFFEKENTNTLYMDNEMILTFMMSQAQAESESLSGSVKWGHRKNFKDGKVYYHYASFLGYRKGPDGLPEIDPDEAAIVRRIFARYLLGQSVHQICRDLMSDGVKTAQGSDSWHDSVVRKMLQNEKYIGDALLHESPQSMIQSTADFLIFSMKKP